MAREGNGEEPEGKCFTEGRPIEWGLDTEHKARKKRDTIKAKPKEQRYYMLNTMLRLTLQWLGQRWQGRAMGTSQEGDRERGQSKGSGWGTDERK